MRFKVGGLGGGSSDLRPNPSFEVCGDLVFVYRDAVEVIGI